MFVFGLTYCVALRVDQDPHNMGMLKRDDSESQAIRYVTRTNLASITAP